MTSQTSPGRTTVAARNDAEPAPTARAGDESRIDLGAELDRLDALFGGVLAWLPRLYDQERGGFYYALSSLTVAGFEADIESTSAAIRIVKECDLVGALPAAIRSGLITFLTSRQDPDTGLFLDPHNRMRTIERMRGRALGAATLALDLLDAAPRYSLPGVDHGEEFLRHLQSVDAFERWLAQRPWDNSWLAQDNIQAQAPLIKQLPRPTQDAIVDTALDHVRRRQDPHTGLAGGGAPYVRVSGAFKLALFCRAFGRSVPYGEQIYERTLQCVRTEDCADACWLRNPIELVEVLKPQLGGRLPAQDVAELVRISTSNAVRFTQPDGGFSRKVGRSSGSPNEVELGLGLAEGDLNATVQLVTIVRPALYRLAGRQPHPLPAGTGWAQRFGARPASGSALG